MHADVGIGLLPGLSQSCVSSRVSGLQEASLWLQLLLRLSALLATWARGSERMRYLWGEHESPERCPPPKGRALSAGTRHLLARGQGTHTMSLGSSLVSGGGLMRT